MGWFWIVTGLIVVGGLAALAAADRRARRRGHRLRGRDMQLAMRESKRDARVVNESMAAAGDVSWTDHHRRSRR